MRKKNISKMKKNLIKKVRTFGFSIVKNNKKGNEDNNSDKKKSILDVDKIPDDEKEKKLLEIKEKLKQLKQLEEQLEKVVVESKKKKEVKQSEKSNDKLKTDENEPEDFDQSLMNGSLESRFRSVGDNDNLEEIANHQSVAVSHDDDTDISNLYGTKHPYENYHYENGHFTKQNPTTYWSDSAIRKFQELYYSFNEVKPFVENYKEVLEQFDSAYKLINSIRDSIINNYKRTEDSTGNETVNSYK